MYSNLRVRINAIRGYKLRWTVLLTGKFDKGVPEKEGRPLSKSNFVVDGFRAVL